MLTNQRRKHEQTLSRRGGRRAGREETQSTSLMSLGILVNHRCP